MCGMLIKNFAFVKVIGHTFLFLCLSPLKKSMDTSYGMGFPLRGAVTPLRTSRKENWVGAGGVDLWVCRVSP